MEWEGLPEPTKKDKVVKEFEKFINETYMFRPVMGLRQGCVTFPKGNILSGFQLGDILTRDIFSGDILSRIQIYCIVLSI